MSWLRAPRDLSRRTDFTLTEYRSEHFTGRIDKFDPARLLVAPSVRPSCV